MNPTIKKLPKGVQTLICASSQINCYTKAVQELVFNALDADATSIAVRIHIAEGSIQVVDNGCGISKADLKYIGQNYMTSKLADISTLKSAPNKYGFQGQSLANIAQISVTLNVTSRFHKSDTTWVKIIENGKAKSIAQCSSRPSKGTTIEIKGFLYNLTIQKKSIDIINELQSIKTILEHVSLVHSCISLSLRDDSKNEIVFKIHKNRDMYQTLYTLYDIEKTNVQELQVEKNQYKVKAFVGKRDVEISQQSIFLNGKFIGDASILYKKVNNFFKKYLGGGQKKIKRNVFNDEEHHIFRNNIPFYFIFITCPYIDYELTNTVLEFKNWGQINTMLDKLVKFYIGDTKLQEVPKHTNRREDKPKTDSTRNQIEKIIHKVLGNHCKKPEIALMQKGVKGKLIRRKTKSKNDVLKVTGSNKYDNRQNISKQCITLNNEKDPNKDITLEKSRNFGEGHSPDIILSNSVVELSKAKIKLNSKIKTRKQQSRTNHKTAIKQNDERRSKKLSLNSKFAMETASVKKRCEIITRKTEEFLNNNKRDAETFITENCEYTRSNFITNNKDIAIKRKVKEVIIREYIPLPLKLNYYDRIGSNVQNKQFQSNYDLLQTIIHSPNRHNESEQRANVQDRSIVTNFAEPGFHFMPKNRRKNTNNFKRCLNDRNCVSLVKEINDQVNFQEEIFNHEPKVKDRDEFPLHYKSHVQVSMRNDRSSPFNADNMPDANISLRSPVRQPDSILTPDTGIINSNIRPYLMRASDVASPFQVVTFQSHNYIEEDFQTESNVELHNLYKRPRNFITMQSRENFMNNPENHRFKTNKINFYTKLFKSNKHKRKLNKSIKMFNIEKNMVKGIRESYTIEFTDSNESKTLNTRKDNTLFIKQPSNLGSVEAITASMSHLFRESRHKHVPTYLIANNNKGNESDLDYEPLSRNNFTINNSYRENYLEAYLDSTDQKKYETYTIDSSNKCCFIRGVSQNSHKTSNLDNTETSKTDLVFLSKSQEHVNEKPITNPIDVCESVLESYELSTNGIREFDSSFRCIHDPCDNLNRSDNDVNDIDLPMESTHTKNEVNQCHEKQQLTKSQDLESTSHHFTTLCQSPAIIHMHGLISTTQHRQKTTLNELDFNEQDKNVDCNNANEENETGAFNIRNRMFFVPKGMSPIFDECHTKNYCEYNPKEDYYEDKMYNDFMDKIEEDTEIFKPRVPDSSDITAKNTKKANSKLNKDNDSLKFDRACIKNATVLGQVDSKFIAAIMRSKSHDSGGSREFLVLFDQHAVDERIRLESNLADYLVDSQWKSVAIDAVSLKMNRDEVLYLHNYRDKFTQFGLQWDIVNYNDVSITAIPEGILGKNPRQVEKIIKAVKNLIREEINIIQMQKGCVSQYPKSIMDLIFSEACRYAIKFGDHISKSQCIELLNGLSNCKTPFQCAHGRPSMAVIMNIERHQASYKINFKNLTRFINL